MKPSGDFLSYIGYLANDPDADKAEQKDAKRGERNLQQGISTDGLAAAMVAVLDHEENMEQIDAKAIVAEHFDHLASLFTGSKASNRIFDENE